MTRRMHSDEGLLDDVVQLCLLDPERAGHAPGEVFILESAGTENEKRIAGTDGEIGKLEGIHESAGSSSSSAISL